MCRGDDISAVWPAVRAARPPERPHHPIHHDRVRAKLAGVLDRTVQPPSPREGGTIYPHGSGIVDPPPARPADPEPAVQPPVLIREHEARPAQVTRQRPEPLRRAEPDENQSRPGRPGVSGSRRRPPVFLSHLNQMLVAGQSMPVPEQDQDLNSRDIPQAQPDSAGRGRERQIAHRHVDIDLPGDLCPSAHHRPRSRSAGLPRPGRSGADLSGYSRRRDKACRPAVRPADTGTGATRSRVAIMPPSDRTRASTRG